MQTLSKFFTSYKPLFVTLGVVLIVLIAVPLVGILSVEGYLKKALYPQVNLMVYENAQQTLSKTSWAWMGLPLLALDNALRPDQFLHLSDLSYEKQFEAFDYTVRPATFSVTAVNQTTKTLTLDKIIPTMLKGERTQTRLLCNKNTTSAVELTKQTVDIKPFANPDGSIDFSKIDFAKLDADIRQVSIPGTAFDFLVDQFTRSDIKAGTKHIELQTTCMDRACTATGIVCTITIT